MDEIQILDFVRKTKDRCGKLPCFKCIFRSEKGKNKCILNDIPEMWDYKKLEENVRVNK